MAQKYRKETVERLCAEKAELLGHIETLETENARLCIQLSDLCPIGDFDVITSLQGEKTHMAEEVAELSGQLAVAVEALERIERESTCGGNCTFEGCYGVIARQTLSRIQGKEKGE